MWLQAENRIGGSTISLFLDEGPLDHYANRLRELANQLEAIHALRLSELVADLEQAAQ